MHRAIIDIGHRTILFLRSRGPRLHQPLAKAIDGQLRNDEAQAHRKNDHDGSHAIRDRRAYERQRHMRAVGKLHKAARHPE